jgi:hypothetical protein
MGNGDGTCLVPAPEAMVFGLKMEEFFLIGWPIETVDLSGCAVLVNPILK